MEGSRLARTSSTSSEDCENNFRFCIAMSPAKQIPDDLKGQTVAPLAALEEAHVASQLPILAKRFVGEYLGMECTRNKGFAAFSRGFVLSGVGATQ